METMNIEAENEVLLIRLDFCGPMKIGWTRSIAGSNRSHCLALYFVQYSLKSIAQRI